MIYRNIKDISFYDFIHFVAFARLAEATAEPLKGITNKLSQVTRLILSIEQGAEVKKVAYQAENIKYGIYKELNSLETFTDKAYSFLSKTSHETPPNVHQIVQSSLERFQAQELENTTVFNQEEEKAEVFEIQKIINALDLTEDWGETFFNLEYLNQIRIFNHNEVIVANEEAEPYFLKTFVSGMTRTAVSLLQWSEEDMKNNSHFFFLQTLAAHKDRAHKEQIARQTTK